MAGMRSHARLVLSLLEGGATWIQIREKQLPYPELLAQAGEALHSAALHNTTLVINDWVQLALETAISGVHLGQTDWAVREARIQLPGKIIGLSTHSLAQAREANRLPVDYISIGPIFATQTKTENPHLGVDVLRQVREVVSKPLVAIGGITLANVAQVWQAGADSVAVISDIMTHPDIAARTAEYLDLWKELHA